MSLSPEVLLSHQARIRLIKKLKDLSGLAFKNESSVVRASVLVPICVVKGDVCLLYTLRSLNLNSHSGQVSFPGGKRDHNETATETALRETKEEIGVVCEDIWSIMPEVQGRNKDIIITPVIGYIENFSTKKFIINHEEVEEIFTVPLKTFCDANNHGHFEYNDIMIPVYLGGRHTVWGITAIITHMFLSCFLPRSVYNFDFSRRQFQLNELMSSKL